MKLNKIDFEETNQFSSIFLDYVQNKKELQKHFAYPPNIKSFEQAISHRNFDDTKRAILVSSLQEQYKDTHPHQSVLDNIALLNQKNTFTITTGHQLNIFTGPLYFIYKIVATINMAKMLKEEYPSSNFIPVYWMASEDHDFAEINNFNLFGQKLVWESEQKGPVGKFEIKSMKILLDAINEKPGFITDAYSNCANLAEATRQIVHELFCHHGLVILDANAKALKNEFKSVIKEEIINPHAHELVTNTTGELESMGYKSQIYPRPINFFYMEDGLRERIEEVDGKFKVLNTQLSFSKEEMEVLINESPEKFSPNVVLRPVYQEVILPNLAYLGGPAEVSYWLQLKGVFDHYHIEFPVLFPRNFVMIVPKAIARKMDKLNLDNKDVFKSYTILKDELLYKDTVPAHDLSLQINEIETVFKSIKTKASSVDMSLEGFVLSEFRKVEKIVINTQSKIKRAGEQKEEVRLKQLEAILGKLFPGGNPQEREDNFLNFYINNPKFITELVDLLDPFDLKYNILTDDA